MNSASFALFCEQYSTSEALLQLDAIRLGPAHIEKLYSPLAGFGTLLENYFLYIIEDNRIYDYLVVLNEALKQAVAHQAAGSLRVLINDLIVFASVNPSRILKYNEFHKSQFDYEGEIRRYALRPIAPSVACFVLTELADLLSRLAANGTVIDPDQLLGTSLLSHISPASYLSLRECGDIRAGLLLTSLCNYTSEFRLQIVNDDLCQKIAASPHLLQWMLVCGNADEQHYLNTCDAAAYINALIHHHTHIGTLLCLSDRAINYLKRFIPTLSPTEPAYPAMWSFWRLRPPSIRAFSSRIIAQVEGGFARIRERALRLVSEGLGEEPHDIYSSMSTLSTLIEDWSHQMQILSAVFIPTCPVIATWKPFSQQWHLSAASMTVWSTLAQLFPGAPVYLVRARGAYQLEDIPCYFLHTFSAVLDSDASRKNYLHFARRLRSFQQVKQAPDLIKQIDHMWRDVYFNGGALFSSSEAVWSNWWVGHVSFVLAFAIPEELDNQIRHDFSKAEYIDDGSGEWLCRRVEVLISIEANKRRSHHEDNELLNPHDSILYSATAEKKKFSWLSSLLRTLIKPLRVCGVPVSPVETGTPLLGRMARYFLISDPEIKHYKVVSFEQMIQLVRASKNHFELCNLTPWHKQTLLI